MLMGLQKPTDDEEEVSSESSLSPGEKAEVKTVTAQEVRD